ncbi:hypothetical protein BGW38_010684 [Lunasporangiospora selenospora]|uniref:Snurportin-1 n=1 Tax=Lunasporangiospora selenospora TaxID=979761 RepID=A0A9P6FW66_9FUNG|nr:hypothetical protein BGW38_010684 [Lunasporangiospora selenospora]
MSNHPSDTKDSANSRDSSHSFSPTNNTTTTTTTATTATVTTGASSTAPSTTASITGHHIFSNGSSSTKNTRHANGTTSLKIVPGNGSITLTESNLASPTVGAASTAMSSSPRAIMASTAGIATLETSTTSTMTMTASWTTMAPGRSAAAALVPIDTTPRHRLQHISMATVDALGDLLESTTVMSVPAPQEQRRKDSYKSNALINKTLKQSQEERRRQALAEQTKKRYQFTSHARKLAQFASGQHSDESSASEDEDEEDDNEEEEEEEESDNEQGGAPGEDHESKVPKTKKTKHKEKSSTKGKEEPDPIETILARRANHIKKHKRRLSSGEESETTSGTKRDNTFDALSPKKPRLQKYLPKVPKKKKKKDRNPFRDQLMIPEILADIPLDLDTNYYTVPLPIGHRCFVISADGKTTARLPSGQLLVAAFESCLPAGSSQYRGNRRSDYCILDCVYSSKTRTFWTLDIMCWRGHPVYECETEFRFWWLRGKLAEIESLQSKWMANQTKDWEHEQMKWRLKKQKQAKRRQEKAAAAAAAAAVATENATSLLAGMEIVGGETEKPTLKIQRTLESRHGQLPPGQDLEGDDDIDYNETGMDGIDLGSSSGAASTSTTTNTASRGEDPKTSTNQFWPIVFTPLPYFNASIDLVRLLAEAMYNSESSSSALIDEAVLPGPGDHNQADTTTGITGTLGTMALSGELATAASLFPAHDKAQKKRQEETLVYERAAGLVFFNKKTIYVLGMTPLCGWVSMEKIGDVFFCEEGGVGPVPGTRAVEGREVEMEDALERIRI